MSNLGCNGHNGYILSALHNKSSVNCFLQWDMTLI